MHALQTTVAVDLLQEYAWFVVLVAITARIARAWQAQLTYTEYRALHRLKRGVFPLVDKYAGDAILWVSEKGGRDDAEFITTAEGGLTSVVRRFQDAGASLHLLNSLKRRPETYGDPLSAAHVVWTVGEEQVEGYLFRNDDGTIDVYAHTETSTDDPLGHLTDGQTDGDAHGVLVEALGEHG